MPTLCAWLLLAVQAFALEGWSVRLGDPEGLLAPLDLQVLPGQGDEPALIALIDPASNSGKVRIVNLDGHLVQSPGPANGPDPWQSGLRPFAGFGGPQLPLGAWRGGTWEAVQSDEGVLNLMKTAPGTGELMALRGRDDEARHPGDLDLLPFLAHLWGGDPRDGTVYCAGESGVYRLAPGDGARLPIAVREDWLHLETGPDGTFMLVSGSGHNALDWTAALFDRHGSLQGSSAPGADLTGAITILDQAHAGVQGGWLLLALVQAPYPVSLTQYLNDTTRAVLRERDSMPFLFRFDWRDGRLAALTPLPDLPDDLDLARVSADQQSAIVLVRTPESAFLRILALGNLTSFGDVPLELAAPTLTLPRSMALDDAGQLYVIDQGWLASSDIPVVMLQSPALNEPTALVPLPPAARLDLGGMSFDKEGTLWWGGQVVDNEGVRGAIWQRCDADGTVLDASLFDLLPKDLFALGESSEAAQAPYLLAQTATPDGTQLAITGTFDPAQTWLLELDSAGDPTPRQLPLPENINLLEFATLQLLSGPSSERMIVARSPDRGEVRVWWQRREGRGWESPTLLPSLGAWPIGIRESGDWVWVLPGLGLIESDRDERLLELAANASPWLDQVSQGIAGADEDLLLLRQLGQVWSAGPRAWRRVEDKGSSRVNDALLELDQAMRRYYAREGQFPPAMRKAFMSGELRDYTWEQVWEYFIGGRPLQYRRTDSAFDLVVWGANEDQTLYHLSERGIVPIDPVEGFVPAEQRSSLYSFQ